MRRRVLLLYAYNIIVLLADSWSLHESVHSSIAMEMKQSFLCEGVFQACIYGSHHQQTCNNSSNETPGLRVRCPTLAS